MQVGQSCLRGGTGLRLRSAQLLQYHFHVSSPKHYAEVLRCLSASRALADPAEAHGTLAGALCALLPYRFEDWKAEILPDDAPDTPADPVLLALYNATVAALDGGDMAFDILIPDDDQPLEARTRALSEWCTGFLYGLGSNGAADPQRLPGELGEVVRDLSEITLAGVDHEESAEANEAAFAELVEFVRIGVQLLFEELEPARQRHQIQPPAARHSLH